MNKLIVSGVFVATVLLFGSVQAQQTQWNQATALFEAPYHIEAEIPATAVVIRTAPFSVSSPFGCTEDLAAGEICFGQTASPFTVEFRTKDLVLQRTITVPTPGATFTGIAYDAKNDTIWGVDPGGSRIFEYNKTTGTPTGAILNVAASGSSSGPITIDVNDGLGGDTLYLEDRWTDNITAFNIRTGERGCVHPNPLGFPSYGNGVSYAVEPSFPGELHATAGLDADGQVTDIYRGNPCVEQPYTDPVYIVDALGLEDFPNGIQNSIDPDPTIYPNNVWYIAGNRTNTLIEMHNRKSISDCQGIDDVNVLFVNGDNSEAVSIVEGWPVHFGMQAPPAGGNGRYFAHMNAGSPGDLTIVELPLSLGPVCFDVLLPPFGAGSPLSVWNNIGQTPKVGASNYFGASIPNPAPAPAFFHDGIQGDVTNLPAGTVFTMQGVIINPAASSPKSASVSNAVVVTVEAPPF